MSNETALEAAFDAALQRVMKRALAPQPDAPFTAARMLELADDAVAHVDLWGPRGLTGLSTEHIAAMACVIAMTGATDLVRARMAAAATDTMKRETR